MKTEQYLESALSADAFYHLCPNDFGREVDSKMVEFIACRCFQDSSEARRIQNKMAIEFGEFEQAAP